MMMVRCLIAGSRQPRFSLNSDSGRLAEAMSNGAATRIIMVYFSRILFTQPAHSFGEPTFDDLSSCEQAFSSLLSSLNLGDNVAQVFPQLGFNMGDFLSKFKAAPAAFVSGCKEIGTCITKTADSVIRISEVVQAAVPWLKGLLTASILCVCAGVLIYAIQARRPILGSIVTVLITGLITVQGYLYHQEITELLSTLSSRLPDPNREYKQGDASELINKAEGDEHTPLVAIDQSLISKLFVSVFSAGFFLLGEKNKTTFTILKDYVVHFPSMVKGIDQVTEFSSSLVLKMLNYLRSSFGYDKYDSLWEHTDPFLKWMDEVTLFLNQFASRDRKPDNLSYGLINTYIEQGRKHSLFLKSISDDVGARARLGTVLSQLATARDQCIHLNKNIVSGRPEPVCIFLYGTPGRGKTVFAKLLAQAWLSGVLNEVERELFSRNFDAYVYHRTPETEYWDGYANQPVTIFDDFFQKMEVAGGDSAAMDIVRCLNNNPALLHMAALNDKGTTYFTSKLVILSSNTKVPISQAITCPRAFLRRPDMWIDLDLQPELLRPTKTLGDAGVDVEALAAIGTSDDWVEKTSVYSLKRFEITHNMEATRGTPIAPIDVLEFIRRKHRFNEDKFSGVLPPIPPAKLAHAENLKQKFLRRLDIPPVPAAKVPPPIPPKPKQPDIEEPNPFSEAPAKKPKPASKGKEKVEVVQAPLPAASPDVVIRPYIEEEELPNKPEGDPGIYRTLSKSVPFLQKMHAFGNALERNDPDEIAKAQVDLNNWLVTNGYKWEDFCSNFATYIWWCQRTARTTPRSTVEQSIAEASVPESDVDLASVDHSAYFTVLFRSITTRFAELTSTVKEVFKTYWPYIVGTATAFGIAIFAYKIFKYFSSENEPESLPSRVKPRTVVRRGWAAFKRGQPAAPQPATLPNKAQSSQTQRDQIQKVLRHTYHLMWNPHSHTAFGHVVMLVDRIGVVNIHVCDQIREIAQMEGRKTVWLRPFGKLAQEYEVPVDRFLKVTRDDDALDLDIGLIYLSGTQLPTAPDFTAHLPHLSDIENRNLISVLAPIITRTDEVFSFVSDAEARVNCPTTGPYDYVSETVPRTKIRYTNDLNITYRMETLPGQCGLPLITDSCGQGKYLVGIHKCGTGAQCLAGAAPLTRDWFDRDFEQLKTIYADVKVIRMSEVEGADPPPTMFPQCYPASTLGTVKAFHMNTETKLNPLPHHSDFEQTRMPAQLKIDKLNGKWCSPYIKNREYIPSKLPVLPDIPHMDQLVSKIVNNTSLKERCDVTMWRRKMTFEEALYGIPGTEFKGLDLSSSVGYPYVLTGKTTKRQWVEDPELFKQLKLDVEVADRMLRRGIRPYFLVMDFLKDELRPIAKVKAFETRVVSAESFVSLILNRMYFGGFATWTNYNSIDNGVTIGMNPYSEQWDYMCRRLFKKFHKTFGGDSKLFDRCQHPEILRSLFSAINDWYGKDDTVGNAIRDLLSLDFMFARHVTPPTRVGKAAQDEIMTYPVSQDPFVVEHGLKIVNASRHPDLAWVYLACGGHPSGKFLTALLNSWYSVVVPFLVAQSKLNDLNLVLSWLHTEMLNVVTLGDDFVESSHEVVQPVVNAITIKDFSASYGMVMTRENKEPIVEPFPPDDPIFLKRKMYYMKEVGRWVGALDKHSIIESMCWIRKPRPNRGEILQLFDNAIREMSFWGRDDYDHWAPLIEKAARSTLNTSYSVPRWRDALDAAMKSEADYRP